MTAARRVVPLTGGSVTAQAGGLATPFGRLELARARGEEMLPGRKVGIEHVVQGVAGVTIVRVECRLERLAADGGDRRRRQAGVAAGVVRRVAAEIALMQHTRPLVLEIAERRVDAEGNALRQ